jgi:hypothetical protein
MTQQRFNQARAAVPIGIAALLLASAAPVPPSAGTDQPEKLPAPRIQEPAAGAALPPKGEATNAAVGITLVDALRIASLANFDIAQARQLVAVAQAGVQRAQALALPSIVFNPQYIYHTGKIQKTEGNIITSIATRSGSARGPP